ARRPGVENRCPWPTSSATHRPRLLWNSRGEDRDGVDAVVAGASQDVPARFGIAQAIALRPVVRFEKISEPLPPIAIEHRLLNIVTIDDGRGRARLDEIRTRVDRLDPGSAQRGERCLAALLERAPAALLERALDFSELDPPLELGVAGQEHGGEHLRLLD